MGCRDDLMYLTVHDLIERFIAADKANGDYVRQIHALQSELRAAQDSLAKLEAKKEAEPIPTFEVGKCYRTRNVRLGIVKSSNGDRMVYALHDDPVCSIVVYRNGRFWSDGATSDNDLLPGAVDPPPTWTPPASMESGVWKFCTAGMMHPNGKHGFMDELRAAIWRDWTDPPRKGLWQVKYGKATYLGEA